MQGALTSKSDYIGGIFDRFINTVSEELTFNKLILPEIKTDKQVSFVSDFYYYKPTKNGAGIAPDIFGIKVDDKLIPFTVFEDKWMPVDNMPQIEVKTFKAKDQMVSLRNQGYDGMTLVLVNLKLRIDYLVPFLDKNQLSDNVYKEMLMDDSVFIKKDTKKQVISNIKVDFGNDEIGNLSIIAITNASDFTAQATKCCAGVGARRMKSIRTRQKLMKNSLGDWLTKYCNKSPRISSLFEFNDSFYALTGIHKANTLYVDFSADSISDLELCAVNKNSIVICAHSDDCSFNDQKLENGKQYMIDFETLKRDGAEGEEYFMQKQCASHLRSLKADLLSQLSDIVNNN